MVLGPGSKAVLFIAAVVVILTGMRLAAPILLPLMFATFLAIVTLPLMGALSRRGLPAWASVTIAVLVDLAALVGVASLVATSIAGFNARLADYQKRAVALVGDINDWLYERDLGALVQDSEYMDPSVLFGMVAGLLRSAAGLATNFALVFVLLAFILVEISGLRRKLELLVGDSPEQLERFAAGAMQVQKYLLVKSVASAVTGILAGLSVWALGVDLPLVWGLVAFVLNYVPAVGSVIAALPPVLVALLIKGPGTAALVAAAYISINMAIGNFIEPRVMGRTLGLSPLVVVLSVVFWGFILGPAGALLSVPLTVVVKILMANSDDLRWVAVALGPSVADPTRPARPLPPPAPPG